MENIYYDPKKFDLEIVELLEEDGLDYQFNMFVVWRSIADGKLYWAEDSGCSCPSPFEEYTGLGDLTEIKSHEFDAFERAVNAFPVTASEKINLISKVKGLLKP